jgi:hypothetical protein
VADILEAILLNSAGVIESKEIIEKITQYEDL